jgi:hypothetical protein
LQKHIDLKKLAERLSRVFPDLVVLSDDVSSISILGRVMVTSNGLAEGSGPVADRVKEIFEDYMKNQSPEQLPDASLTRREAKVRNPFRCQHCALRMTSGRVYRRTMGGTVMLFCCKQCADHEETEIGKLGTKYP